MNDLISRQAAIKAFLTELTKRERKNLLHTWSTVEVKYFVADMLEKLPSVQPYTDEEIQKMQDIEQAQLDKAYEMGKADALRWIPCSEKEAEYPCLACDVFGQIFITNNGIVRINGECYDGTGFDFSNAEEFLKGIKVGNSMRMLPRKIVAWSPLPEPYKEVE
jgi:hypothetical protein